MVAKKILNEKGQAFLELIFFLPVMTLLLALLVVIGNSLNGAINQQKVTRSYFYSRLKNHSGFPRKSYTNGAQNSWRLFGMHFIGWRERFVDGDVPVQPCYKLKLPFGSEETKCDEYKGDSTPFIRVGTVYGACGATYIRGSRNGLGVMKSPSIYGGNDFFYSSIEDLGCTIRE